MNYIFVAPIENLKQYYKYYKTVCDALNNKGNIILDDWISLIDVNDEYKIQDIDTRKEVFYESYRHNLKKTDFVIFDTSVVSRTVQYEIAMSLFADIPTICLKKNDGSGISGILTKIQDKNLHLYEYSNCKDLKELIINSIQTIWEKKI